MSQHDFDITTADANTGLLMRAAINAALQALASSNGAATAPGTTYAFQLWADTTSGFMKIRNAANNGWIQLFPLAVAFSASALANAVAIRNATGGFTGDVTAANVNVTDNSGVTNQLSITGTGGSGANIKLAGNGGTTPNKYIRSESGKLSVVNSAYTTEILSLTDTGVLSASGGFNGTASNADTLDGYHAAAFALASAFANYANYNGYQQVAGGLIIQWGATTANNSGVSTTFPIAFPTVCFFAGYQSTYSEGYPSANVPTKDRFSAYFNCGYAIPINWLALGY